MMNGLQEFEPHRMVGTDRNTPGQAVSIPQMPAQVIQAICAVQSTITSVPKTGRNDHGRYNFASADDIYAALSVKLAQAGLVIFPIELQPVETMKVENKEGKTSQWGRFRFGYVLACEDVTWFDPRSARSLFIQITGPQTFNAAESYCQKSFLRALFKLPTGDMDLDSLPQSDSKPKSRKSSAQSKRDGTAAKWEQYKAQIRECTTRDQLMELKGAWMEETADWPNKWMEIIDDEWNDQFEAVQQ